MNRFNPPLTPAETTALQQACADMDKRRTIVIEDQLAEERCSLDMANICEKENLPNATLAYLCDAAGHHLAAALLAGQMAERL